MKADVFRQISPSPKILLTWGGHWRVPEWPRSLCQKGGDAQTHIQSTATMIKKDSLNWLEIYLPDFPHDPKGNIVGLHSLT